MGIKSDSDKDPTARQDFDAWAKICHRCTNPACGVEWDQDVNATYNLLQSNPLIVDGPQVGRREGKWSRVKREKREKEEGKDRESDGDASAVA
jgi:hypothetical protein